MEYKISTFRLKSEGWHCRLYSQDWQGPMGWLISHRSSEKKMRMRENRCRSLPVAGTEFWNPARSKMTTVISGVQLATLNADACAIKQQRQSTHVHTRTPTSESAIMLHLENRKVDRLVKERCDFAAKIVSPVSQTSSTANHSRSRVLES